MAGTLPKALLTALLATVVFAISFAALFMRSERVFIQILARREAPSPEALLSKAEQQEFVYWSFRTSEINKMIDDLKAQREQLLARQEAISAQEAQIQTERKENERLRDEILRVRKELSDYIIEVKAGEAVRLREEVAIVNNMAPANVVTLFNEKSDEDVVKLLAMMKPDVSAPILDLMMTQPQPDANGVSPEKRVTILLEKLKRLRMENAAGAR
ncbi:MAG: hypothetical protein JW942_06055 [Opitutales bacterium]|nr:hypothetical protein [Opitutales bacterium]